MSDIFEDDILQAYLVEAREHLDVAEQSLLALEQQGENFDPALINETFRAVHTVKGGASFYGLENINNLSHEVESLMDLIRKNKLKPTPAITDQFLKSIDMLICFIEDPKSSNDADISPLLNSLKNAVEDSKSSNKKEASTQKKKSPPPPEPKKEEKKAAYKENIKITDISDNDTHRIQVNIKGHEVEFECDYEELKSKREPDKFLYFIFLDLIEDCQKKNRTPLDFIQKASFIGEIITSSFSPDTISEDDGEPSSMPAYLLYSSALEMEHLQGVLDLTEGNICEWKDSSTEGPPEEPVMEEPQEKMSDSTFLPVKAPSQDIPVRKEDEVHLPDVPSESPMPVRRKEKKAESSLRIDINLLDKLMSLAGELVLSRNQMMQMIAINDMESLQNISQRINIITTELQENIMRTRMQPIGNVFSKYPRIVRDLSRNLGKDIDFIIKGKEVELDKNIVENLSDPLTHLVRNSVDHGIEIPSKRKAAGKEPTGKLMLCAYHEGGQVNIDIIDDGAGIDVHKLKRKAVEKGLLSQADVENMSDRDALNLIFLPGFSMAKEITDVSGRGVGMDVVKTSFEKLGGIIDIQSEVGKGTTINIKLPLTLAIIPSLIVKSRNERFAIPQMNLVELVKIKAADIKEKIESIHGIEVFRLRGRLLPLLRLRSVLYPDSIDLSDEEKDINIVVLAAGNQKYGIIVDGLNDSEEIVVKPLGRHLKDCKCYAGATIMGDGRVALILDVQGIANYSGLVQDEDLTMMDEDEKKETASLEDRQSVILFNNGTKEQFSVSLALVSRIDRVKTSHIEHIGGRDLIKYRGNSLPVIRLEKYLELDSPPEQDNLYVVFFKIKGRDIGLIARNIVDTKELNFEIDTATLKQTGIMGSSIIDDITTLFLDIFEIVEMAEPSWFEGREAVTVEDNKNPSILLVEDSNFFRAHVKNYLQGEGYEVIEAFDGKDGFEKLCKNRVNLVITDIEMPVMNGYELTKKIKSDERFRGLKVIALTAMAGEEDVQKGVESGVDSYQIKFDRETLLDDVMTMLRGDVATMLT